MPRTIGVPPTKNRNSVLCCSPPCASSLLNDQQQDQPEQEKCAPFNLNFSNPGGGDGLLLQDSFDSGMMMLGNEDAECSEPTSKESTPLSLLPNGPTDGMTGSGKNAKSTINLLPNGKKTKGRVKIKMEYIGNKLRRYTTFSKRKTGIMKKAHELSTLTGTQVMLLVASETGHVYAFATSKLKPMIVSEQGKSLIQGCLSTPDENFPDMGAVKTEFTFEPPSCSSITPNGQQQQEQQQPATSSSTSRKRKLGQGQVAVEAMESLLPTMVSNSLQVTSCSPTFKQEYMEEEEEEDEEEEDDEEEEEQEGRHIQPEEQVKEEITSPSVPKKSKPTPKTQINIRNTKTILSNGVGGRSESLQLQKTIKEALKAAAHQRQRQSKAFNSSANPQVVQTNQQHQQLNGAMGLLPLMLQGITNCVPSTSCSPEPVSYTNSKKRSTNTSTTSSNHSSTSSTSTILYQMPQGVVYCASPDNVSGLNTGGNAANNQSNYNTMMNLLLNAANSSSSSNTPATNNVFGVGSNSSQQQPNDQDSNNVNMFQQLFGGTGGFSFGNMTFQQILATATLSQLASENAKS